MGNNGKNWAAWLRANWLTTITIAIWLVFSSYFPISFIEANFWDVPGMLGVVISDIPNYFGGAFLLFGIGVLVMVSLQKLPVVKGMICGFSSCLAGGGFLWFFYYVIMYS